MFIVTKRAIEQLGKRFNCRQQSLYLSICFISTRIHYLYSELNDEKYTVNSFQSIHIEVIYFIIMADSNCYQNKNGNVKALII